jgi:hypothetical protein
MMSEASLSGPRKLRTMGVSPQPSCRRAVPLVFPPLYPGPPFLAAWNSTTAAPILSWKMSDLTVGLHGYKYVAAVVGYRHFTRCRSLCHAVVIRCLILYP